MEKILLAIDSQNLDQNSVHFAAYLTRLTQSKLNAIFLEDVNQENEVIIEGRETEDGGQVVTIRESVDIEQIAEIRDENILLFRELIRKEGIPASVYLDKGVPARDIIAESRFADLLVVDAGTSFPAEHEGRVPNFVKDILQEAGCPVVISPETFEDIENIIFCYDGNKSSIFAMKQFSYLFHDLRSKRAKVIDLSDGGFREEKDRVTEWIKYHYSDVEWIPAEADVTEALFNYLLRKKNDFVVMGAYGRGLLASFFGKDPEDGTVRTTSLPIFVAHC
ncbi:MAG TPA: universal stress protein [Puia sp.]|nr:universal stress protein [Puia sp.]